VLAFDRDGVRCIVNFSGPQVPLNGDVVVASEPVGDTLPPGAAAWASIRPASRLRQAREFSLDDPAGRTAEKRWSR
jgi:hypothetical protein